MNSFVGYNIIGDIRGMYGWKSLVKYDCINVFVGDYFDPITPTISHEKCVANFNEIIDFKKDRPETIMLYGDHELQYLIYGEYDESYSPIDEDLAPQIQQLLHDNASFFNGIAYSINNQYLVTHVGVSRYWYHRYFGSYNQQTPEEVASQLNNLFGLTYRPFLAHENLKYDFVGKGTFQSPLLMDPHLLIFYNIFEGTSYKQIFGLFPYNHIIEKNGLIWVDWVDYFGVGKLPEPKITSFYIENE